MHTNLPIDQRLESVKLVMTCTFIVLLEAFEPDDEPDTDALDEAARLSRLRKSRYPFQHPATANISKS